MREIKVLDFGSSSVVTSFKQACGLAELDHQKHTYEDSDDVYFIGELVSLKLCILSMEQRDFECLFPGDSSFEPKSSFISESRVIQTRHLVVDPCVVHMPESEVECRRVEVYRAAPFSVCTRRGIAHYLMLCLRDPRRPDGEQIGRFHF